MKAFGKSHKAKPKKNTETSRPGNELDHYQPKKDALTIPATKLAKGGMTRRRIAKTLGISRARVDEILG